MRKLKFSKIWYVVALLLLCNGVVFAAAKEGEFHNYLTLDFFDIGQGDSIYFRTPEGNDVLIDGGPTDAVLSKLGDVMPFFDRKIELVIATHPHADHISGLIEVFKRYKVDMVLMPDVEYDSDTYREFLDLLKEKNIALAHPVLGARILLDSETVLDILYPLNPKFEKPPADLNDVSIVGRLSFGTSNILFTGDAGKDIEKIFLDLNLPITAEILKVGHHGSKHSSSSDFLEKVNPDFAVISVGKNSYGHPSQETLVSLEAEKIETLRTDKHGDVKFLVYPSEVVLSDSK